MRDDRHDEDERPKPPWLLIAALMLGLIANAAVSVALRSHPVIRWTCFGVFLIVVLAVVVRRVRRDHRAPN